MRRTITAIVAFFVWILFVGLSLTIMDASLLLGIFAMAAFTMVILFGYVMIDDIMADLDEEEAEEKKRKKAREIKPYYDENKDRITVKVRFKGYQWEEEKPKPAPKIKKVKVKKKKLSSDFAPQEREYRGKEGINFQKLD